MSHGFTVFSYKFQLRNNYFVISSNYSRYHTPIIFFSTCYNSRLFFTFRYQDFHSVQNIKDQQECLNMSGKKPKITERNKIRNFSKKCQQNQGIIRVDTLYPVCTYWYKSSAIFFPMETECLSAILLHQHSSK